MGRTHDQPLDRAEIARLEYERRRLAAEREQHRREAEARREAEIDDLFADLRRLVEP